MKRKAKEFPLFEKVTIVDAGSEGNAIARVGEQVVFVPFAVPGDVVDIRINRRRRSYMEGRVVKLHRPSVRRTEPVCSHFGLCGGCRWQQMRYEDQLYFKQKQVEDSMKRIGKLSEFDLLHIIPSEHTTSYRNKLEFTFSNRGWMTYEEWSERNEDQASDQDHRTMRNALGFHMPGMFDRVLDIRTCHLQGEPSNDIRLAIKKYALERDLAFYDVKNRSGFLRNLIVRTTLTGEVMVILVVCESNEPVVNDILDHIARLFPSVISLFWVLNAKQNDSLAGSEFNLYKGDPVISERMKAFNEGDPDLIFGIGPASFFQTNSLQAEVLYRTAACFASPLEGKLVLDLYSGTGSIATYLAKYVKQVIGIESVEAAVGDAQRNVAINGIRNVRFVAGAVEKVLNQDFTDTIGKPDIIITDPPRAGMHPASVGAILDAEPEIIVYISCNPATQARDLSLMNHRYRLVKCQPVDMFPHTQHVENIALLGRRAKEVTV